MSGDVCWRCSKVHPEPGQSCSEATASRIAAYTEEVHRMLDAIEKCSHGVPLSHCKEHRQARAEASS